MTGDAHFNEVFLDGVRIPASSVVGSVDAGWSAARTLLVHERLAVSAGLGVENESDGPLSYNGIVGRVAAAGVLDDPLVADMLVDLYLASQGAQLVDARLAQEIDRGGDPGSRGSVGKLLKARFNCLSADLAGSLLGVQGLDADMRDAVLGSRSLAIGGGTNEIQLSIIGERVLGLPREPVEGLDVPFRELMARCSG